MSQSIEKNTSFIISCRAAFALFVETKSFSEVMAQFPECLSFVQYNQDKTLEEVTNDLSTLLDLQLQKKQPD